MTVESLENVAVKLKANVYFEGKVVSHTLNLKDGSRKTVGIIYPGVYKFDTDAPERMDVLAGECRVKISGATNASCTTCGNGASISGSLRRSQTEVAGAWARVGVAIGR